MFFLPLEDKHSLVCAVLEVDVARFQNRVGRWGSELHTSSHTSICLVAARHHIMSSGLCVRLAIKDHAAI